MKKILFLMAVIAFITAGCSAGDGSGSSKDNQVPADNSGQTADVPSQPKDIWSGVRIVTENYPPLNYWDEATGEIKGESTVLIKQAMASLGLDLPIKVYPWARAYQIALEEENVFIYSIVRTEERENLFKWVAPVMEMKVYMYALKNRGIDISDLSDAKDYTIATMKEDFTEQNLKQWGYEKNILSSPNQIVSITQLFEGRADLWIATADGSALEEICRQAGYDINRLEVVYELKDLSADVYIAASLKTSDEIVEKFRQAMPGISN